MTYASRGRSLIEILLATTLVCFLVGFVCVLCWGNWFRARQAQERQRQRRLDQQMKQQHRNNNTGGMQPLYADGHLTRGQFDPHNYSPRSNTSSNNSSQGGTGGGGGQYDSLLGNNDPVHRRPVSNGGGRDEDLFLPSSTHPQNTGFGGG